MVLLIVAGDDNTDILMVIYELPLELLESLLPQLTPLALQKLQENLWVHSFFPNNSIYEK